MPVYLMCPACGEFIGIEEYMRTVTCPHCGTVHKLQRRFFAPSNKDYYDFGFKKLDLGIFPGKDIYPKLEFNSAFKHKIPQVKMKLYLLGCFLMKNGRYEDALKVFTGSIADFRDSRAKAEECRQHLSAGQGKAGVPAETVPAQPSVPAEIKRTQFYVPARKPPAQEESSFLMLVIDILGTLGTMWLLIKILEMFR